VLYPVPSLNALFGMNRWQRLREKKRCHAAVFSSLRATGDGYLIRTTSVPNTSLTRLGTPWVIDNDTPKHLHLQTHQEKVSHKEQEKTLIELEI
jgi:hypothetical protein